MPEHDAIRAVVFDFDGTLAEMVLDFTDMKHRLAALAEAYLDTRPSPDGLLVLEWLEQLTSDVAARIDHATAREFATRARFMIMDLEMAAAKNGRLFPATRPALAGLRRNNVLLGVITRNCTPAVTTAFPDIRDHVDVVLAREDVPRTKPDPAHLLAALHRLRMAPEHALMVGDHPSDIDTGRAAGVRTAAVASGYQDRHALAAAGPDFLADNVESLLRDLTARGLL